MHDWIDEVSLIVWQRPQMQKRNDEATKLSFLDSVLKGFVRIAVAGQSGVRPEDLSKYILTKNRKKQRMVPSVDMGVY